MILKTRNIEVQGILFTVPQGISLAGRNWVVRYGEIRRSFAHHSDSKEAFKQAVLCLIDLMKTETPALGLHSKRKGVDPRLPIGVSGPLLRKMGTSKEYGCFSVCIPLSKGKVVYREVYIGTLSVWSDSLVERKLADAIALRERKIGEFVRRLKSDTLLEVPRLKKLIEKL